MQRKQRSTTPENNTHAPAFGSTVGDGALECRESDQSLAPPASGQPRDAHLHAMHHQQQSHPSCTIRAPLDAPDIAPADKKTKQQQEKVAPPSSLPPGCAIVNPALARPHGLRKQRNHQASKPLSALMSSNTAPVRLSGMSKRKANQPPPQAHAQAKRPQQTQRMQKQNARHYSEATEPTREYEDHSNAGSDEL